MGCNLSLTDGVLTYVPTMHRASPYGLSRLSIPFSNDSTAHFLMQAVSISPLIRLLSFPAYSSAFHRAGAKWYLETERQEFSRGPIGIKSLLVVHMGLRVVHVDVYGV